ncbi:hypothetical protein NL676_021230 [Syzygium grande]|nr:hypothetical protein NL676_021230 [Syzygium grande]
MRRQLRCCVRSYYGEIVDEMGKSVYAGDEETAEASQFDKALLLPGAKGGNILHCTTDCEDDEADARAVMPSLAASKGCEAIATTHLAAPLLAMGGRWLPSGEDSLARGRQGHGEASLA